MIEIRQVREEELDSMITCMTTAFGVPKEEWEDGLRNGPYNDLKYKRVVIVDGKVVTCLVIIPAEIYLGGSTVSMGGVAGVATHPAERKHGYASMLMEDSVHALRDLGFATSGLYPYSYRYYRKFGWEFASHWFRMHIKPRFLPRYSESRRVRPYQETDLPDVMRLYDKHYRSMVGPFVRDERHWRRHVLPRAGESWVYDNGGVQGYLLGFRGEEDGEDRYWAHEVVAETDEARRGLIGYLARRTEVDRVQIPSCKHSLESLRLLVPRAHWEDTYNSRSTISITPGFMFRVIDLKAAMKALLKRIDHLDGDLTIYVDDQIGTWNNEPVTVRGGNAPEIVDGESPNWIRADIRIFSQLYTGYMSAADACSQRRIEFSGPDAQHVAQQLFPEYEPFVPYLDGY